MNDWRMIMKRIIVLLGVILLLSGCHIQNDREELTINEDIPFTEGKWSDEDKDWSRYDNIETPNDNLKKFAGKPITAREDAIIIAEAVLENEKKYFLTNSYELVSVFHDNNDDFWAFQYAEHHDETVLQNTIYVVVDGSNSEIIAKWLD